MGVEQKDLVHAARHRFLVFIFVPYLVRTVLFGQIHLSHIVINTITDIILTRALLAGGNQTAVTPNSFKCFASYFRLFHSWPSFGKSHSKYCIINPFSTMFRAPSFRFYKLQLISTPVTLLYPYLYKLRFWRFYFDFEQKYLQLLQIRDILILFDSILCIKRGLFTYD